MLRSLREKADRLCDQVGYFSREIDTISKKMKILEMKSTVTEITNAFSELISKLGVAKEKNL